jgi:hypothetical protein
MTSVIPLENEQIDSFFNDRLRLNDFAGTPSTEVGYSSSENLHLHNRPSHVTTSTKKLAIFFKKRSKKQKGNVNEIENEDEKNIDDLSSPQFISTSNSNQKKIKSSSVSSHSSPSSSSSSFSSSFFKAPDTSSPLWKKLWNVGIFLLLLLLVSYASFIFFLVEDPGKGKEKVMGEEERSVGSEWTWRGGGGGGGGGGREESLIHELEQVVDDLLNEFVELSNANLKVEKV